MQQIKYQLLIIAFVLLRLGVAGQSVNWEKASDWTLYAVHGKDMFKLPVDSVEAFPQVTMSADSVRYLLTNLTILNTKKVPVWMGGFVITCQFDQRKRKLVASSYRGFFYDGEGKQWYRIAPDRQQEWQDYLTNLAAAAEGR